MYLVRGAITRGQRRYDQDEYQSPGNRYYHPQHENNISPLSQRRNRHQRQSYSRSRSGSPPLRNPSSPQVSPPQGTPLPPYTYSVTKRSPPSGQGVPPIVRSKSRDLPSILVADNPQWKI